MLVQDLDQNVKSSCFSDDLFQTEEDLMVRLIKKCLADEVPYLNILSGIIFFLQFYSCDSSDSSDNCDNSDSSDKKNSVTKFFSSFF